MPLNNFRIYKPRFDFDVSLKHDATGKEFTKTVVLSDEENAALAGMSSDEERKVFAANLPATHAALRELAAEASVGGD